MLAKFQGQDWVAEVLTSDVPNPSGFWNVQIRTSGETSESALSSAKLLMDIFAQGREAFIRVEPEVASDREFETKVMRHIGLARCSFRLEAGAWSRDKPSVNIGFGHA